jgi:hypothetical protein
MRALRRLLGGKPFQLLVLDVNFAQESTETSFGGLPLVPDGFVWPTCKACSGAMMFLGKLRAHQNLLLLFMCQNKPGLCGEWEPDGGANAVVKVGLDELHVPAPPAEGQSQKETRYSAKTVTFNDLSYDEARANWAAKNGVSPRHVLGALGGAPSWIQADETPTCSSCENTMRFVAQLETGPDYRDEMNFGGGGCAYIFDCERCATSAKFLWQC